MDTLMVSPGPSSYCSPAISGATKSTGAWLPPTSEDTAAGGAPGGTVWVWLQAKVVVKKHKAKPKQIRVAVLMWGFPSNGIIDTTVTRGQAMCRPCTLLVRLVLSLLAVVPFHVSQEPAPCKVRGTLPAGSQLEFRAP